MGIEHHKYFEIPSTVAYLLHGATLSQKCCGQAVKILRGCIYDKEVDLIYGKISQNIEMKSVLLITSTTLSVIPEHGNYLYVQV